MTAQDHIFELLMEKIKSDPEYTPFDSDAMRRAMFVGTNRQSKPNSGKQLTRFGFNIIKLHFKRWEGKVVTQDFPKYKISQFNAHLSGAWYIDDSIFVVFTPGDFTLFALSGGDLNMFYNTITQ